jgi:hypothetical protein
MPAPPPAPPAAPRLAAQLFTVMGELVMVAVSIVGIVTIVGWIAAGAELRSKSAPTRPPRPPEWMMCWNERRGEWCVPADRPPGRWR